jgi:hypothetical protein
VSLRVGEWVRVRSEAEILATLDERGCLDSLPFTPQMVDYCGKRFRVSKSAHKLCDTVHGTGARRMSDAVLLDDLRCDGAAYGGCEMECLIFWKEAWLDRVSAGEQAESREQSPRRQAAVSPLHQFVTLHTQPPDKQQPGGAPVYSCQATQMPAATTRLSVWDPRQYLQDFVSGNASIGQIVSVLCYLVFDTVAASGIGFGSVMRWGYGRVQGTPYPGRPGKLPKNSRTPTLSLDMRPGERVKVKSHPEVLETVTEDLVNRGMGFHPEMVPYCSGTFVVSKRLRRIMNEKTGQVMELKNPCLTLEGAPCVGRHTKPLLCPRGMSPYWREIWLERIQGAPSQTQTS